MLKFKLLQINKLIIKYLSFLISTLNLINTRGSAFCRIRVFFYALRE